MPTIIVIFAVVIASILAIRLNFFPKRDDDFDGFAKIFFPMITGVMAAGVATVVCCLCEEEVKSILLLIVLAISFVCNMVEKKEKTGMILFVILYNVFLGILFFV